MYIETQLGLSLHQYSFSFFTLWRRVCAFSPYAFKNNLILSYILHDSPKGEGNKRAFLQLFNVLIIQEVYNSLQYLQDFYFDIE